MSTICRSPRTIGVFAGLCAVAACAVPPPRGPTVMALPRAGTSLTVFQQQDLQCHNYAAAAIGFAQPGQAGTQAALGSAAVGTALGAAAGAAIGAAAGNPGAGAAIGGATGLVGGTAVGANNAAASEFDLQTRYNIAYSQCMYAFGNTVTNPPVAYAFGSPWYGYADPWGGPWYDWGAPVFVGGGLFFSRGPGFHHFHGGFHGGGFHGGGPHGGGSHGGGGSHH
jgi:Glycine-zipper domain